MDNSLFSYGEDWKNNACINWMHDSIRLYIDGYRKAADLASHKVIESQSNQDILVYPITFLYRQYIELYLKCIIRESRILLGEGSSFPEHHKIKDLWHVANALMKKIIKEYDASIPDYITKNDLKVIAKIIDDFVEIDPESFSFRYPEDKQGNNNLDGIQYINIRNLYDQMESLAEKLNKFDLVVGLLRDQQSEMTATYCRP